MNRLTALLFMGCTITAYSLGAQAEQPIASEATTSTVVVNYSDLDLNRDEGTQTLYARLKSAARQVCGGQPLLIELERNSRFEACYDKTLDDAVGQVKSRSLQALHDRHEDDATVS
jgi:UrcA family protein